MSPATHLLTALFLPLALAIAQMFPRGGGRAQNLLGMLGTLLMAVNGFALVAAVEKSGPIMVSIGGWLAPVGIALQADMLSALMVAITGVVGFCGAIHAVAEVPEKDARRGFAPLYQFLLFGVTGAFLTGDLFNLYVWFEVMLLSSFVLLAMGGGKDRLEGAVKYVALNLVASFIFLIGAGLLYGALGTLNFADIALKLREGGQGSLSVRVAAGMLFLAFATKAGLFPLYAWLPASYHTPPHTVSAVFAGLLTKVGVYALFRVFGQAFASESGFFFPILAVLSLLTMVAGVFGAASQFHTRKILSFHIISQIGYMTLALAVGTKAALAAGIFYVIHHIVVKTNLFFAAAAIDRAGGGEDLKHTGGLYAKAPWLAVLFLIPAMSLGGIPPLSGFWAKFALLKDLLEGREWLAATVALAVGVLTLFSMTKIWAEAFWKNRPEETGAGDNTGDGARAAIEAARQPSAALTPAHVIPMVILAAATVWLSFFPAGLFDLADTAARQLLEPPAK